MPIAYCCLDCRQPLEEKPGYYQCPKCRHQYRVFAGVPNFKPGEIYPGEERVLEDLEKQYDKMSFEEFLNYADSKKEKNSLPWELRRTMRFENKSGAEKQKWLENYSQEVIIKAGQEQIHVTNILLRYAKGQIRHETCLDIGCGRGPWAVMAAKIYQQIYALDMDMASVIIAKKYCADQGINNITFLAASSSALPFPDNAFDLINSQAVLEHVDIQLKSLEEIQRILAPGGYFVGDSVNRYNMVTPEPHIDLRLIGFMPKSLAHKLSLAIKKFPYDDIKPLSYGELTAMLRQTFGTKYKIIPFVESLQPSLTQSVLKVMPPCFLKHFNHTHYILGTK
ncbi:MAG: methyltransferase domain-containing protein [Candidatus Schekmanbacteria bacterium]|nr:methyltransferase domain-containing protein [Candidatus Schekmanbacteria bacterium]